VVLLTATLRWPIAARLAIAFAGLGCRVAAICPRQHPVLATRALQRAYRYPVLATLSGLSAAINSANPDLVLPCDDGAAVDLQRLHESIGTDVPQAHAMRALIERSMGDPAACLQATARGQLMALAGEVGVVTPANATVGSSAELARWLRQHGFPAVLKLDDSWGGLGVAIVEDLPAALRAFSLMTSRPRLVNALTRLLLDRDPRAFLASLDGVPRAVTVQEFIPGTPANRAVACWQGDVLAGISVEAIRTQHRVGPATVVRACPNPEMSRAVAALVRRLGISGLWGADFILHASTGVPYLIEVNPRATPVCHLAMAGTDSLPAALYSRLRCAVPQPVNARIEQEHVAMFPGEWQRDPFSPYLATGYHDIPWEEPELVRDSLARPWAERGLLARAKLRLRPEVQPAYPSCPRILE
jgi:glutathione synthase/RimK-type ligase-like ATP-grasp enzyme